MMQMERKPAQNFALIVGVLYVVIGIMGFIPALVKAPPTSPEVVGLGFKAGYGYLMGIFPINPLHNVVHLLVGFLGIAASIALDSSRLYSGALALFYGLLAIMGLFPPTQSTLGIIPIFGNDVWLHAITAAIATYFGFFATPDLAQIGSNPSPESGTRSEG